MTRSPVIGRLSIMPLNPLKSSVISARRLAKKESWRNRLGAANTQSRSNLILLLPIRTLPPPASTRECSAKPSRTTEERL